MRWTAAALAVALACGAEPEDTADGLAAERAFSRAHAEAACGLYDRCGLLDTYGATLESCTRDLEAATLAHVTGEGCAFDAAAGEECVAEYQGASCDPDTGGQPTACDAVCEP